MKTGKSSFLGLRFRIKLFPSLPPFLVLCVADTGDMVTLRNTLGQCTVLSRSVIVELYTAGTLETLSPYPITTETANIWARLLFGSSGAACYMPEVKDDIAYSVGMIDEDTGEYATRGVGRNWVDAVNEARKYLGLYTEVRLFGRKPKVLGDVVLLTV